MEEYALVLLGNPSLRAMSSAIPESQFGSKELHHLATYLFNTMQAENGLGLAADWY